MRRIYRHGDVNLIEVSREQFETAKRTGRVLPPCSTYALARGEATGSVHALSVEDAHTMELLECDGRLWLRLEDPGTLTHTSDHAPLTIEPKHYVQVPEREVDYFADAVVRKVVD